MLFIYKKEEESLNSLKTRTKIELRNFLRKEIIHPIEIQVLSQFIGPEITRSTES